MNFINLLLSNFWHFVGLMLFTSLFLTSIVKVTKYVISLLTITFRGYPPEHCDAVGNAYTPTNNKKTDTDEINQTEIE